jgi:hypothetical protein
MTTAKTVRQTAPEPVISAPNTGSPVTPFSVAQATLASLQRIEALLLRDLARTGTQRYETRDVKTTKADAK